MFERLLRRLSAVPPLWLTLFAGAAILAFAVPLCRRGIILSDEGYLLLQSLDMLDGKVLYRDMDAFVTPGVWFLIAALFSVVEPSVIASRILILVAYVATLGVAFRIVWRLCGRAYGLACVFALMLLTVWAFPVWTFTFYSPFAVLFALVALERLLAWHETSRQSALLWCGASLGASIAFKQNYGAFALFGTFASLLAIHLEQRRGVRGVVSQTLRSSLRVGVGVALVGLPLIGYFAYQGALGAAFDSLVIHPFQFMGQHDIPYLRFSALWSSDLLVGVDRLTYGAYALYQTASLTGWLGAIKAAERLHVLLYWLPPLFFALGGVTLAVDARRRGRVDAGLASTLAVCGAVFLGVLPRADFNHLVNVYQPAIVAACIVVHRLARALPQPRPLWARSAAVAGGVLSLLYISISAYWYMALVASMSSEISARRGGVLVALADAQLIDYQVGLIQDETEEGEAVLTVPDLAMLNFLAERPMPSRFYNLYQHHIAHDRGAEVVAASDANDVKLALTRYDDFFSDRIGMREYASDLTDYLLTHFEIAFTVGNEMSVLLRRRDVPLEGRRGLSILGGCEPNSQKHIVRDHLLFSTLYLNADGEGGRDEAETACRLRVPSEGGELVVGVGYRPPQAVQRGTKLLAEIVLTHNGESESLLRETILVRARQNERFRYPLPQERRIDLSHLAGEEVTITFKAVRRGVIRVNPADFRGFAMLWHEPRIETPNDR